MVINSSYKDDFNGGFILLSGSVHYTNGYAQQATKRKQKFERCTSTFLLHKAIMDLCKVFASCLLMLMETKQIWWFIDLLMVMIIVSQVKIHHLPSRKRYASIVVQYSKNNICFANTWRIMQMVRNLFHLIVSFIRSKSSWTCIH